jgi:hypothetical protein
MMGVVDLGMGVFLNAGRVGYLLFRTSVSGLLSASTLEVAGC